MFTDLDTTVPKTVAETAARRTDASPVIDAPASGAPPTPAARGGNRRVAIPAAGLTVAGAMAGLWGSRGLSAGRDRASTDDASTDEAHVRASNKTRAARLPSPIESIAAADNARVRAERDPAFTRVRAWCDGFYIDANFKEARAARLREDRATHAGALH